MSGPYYIQVQGDKDGPLDLVAIMRRVRSGKVLPHTNIYVGDSERPLHAERIPEIAPFFQNLVEGPAAAKAGPTLPNLDQMLKTGWHFTIDHNIMTVYAGSMLLLMLLVVIALINMLGMTLGIVTSWCLFMIMHNFYYIFIARLYRGQVMGDDFINLQLAPALVPLLVSSVFIAVMVAGGLAMLLIPGIMIFTLLIFTPLILLDRQCSISRAFKISWDLNRKAGMKQFIRLCTLLSMHLLCFAFIMPVPLTLPIFTSALCDLYEKYNA